VIKIDTDRDERQIQALCASLRRAFEEKKPKGGVDVALEALMGIDPDPSPGPSDADSGLQVDPGLRR